MRPGSFAKQALCGLQASDRRDGVLGRSHRIGDAAVPRPATRNVKPLRRMPAQSPGGAAVDGVEQHFTIGGGGWCEKMSDTVIAHFKDVRSKLLTDPVSGACAVIDMDRM
jgi:hypothetical protein